MSGLRTALVAGVVGVFASPVAGFAQDYGGNYYEAPASGTSSAMNWTGTYAGVSFGGGWGSSDIDGVLAGVTLGQNWQNNNLLYGLEGDISHGKIDDDSSGPGFKMDWVGTVRGRIGYAFDRFVAFGTGGLAWATTEYADGSDKDSATRLGVAFGLGVEAAFNEHVSAKLDWTHMEFADKTYHVDGDSKHIDPSLDLLRLGVNYRF